MSPKTVWEFECLNCGYRLAEAMVNQARLDYGCPKCGCSFEQFTYRKRRIGKMEAEMAYLLEEKTRKLENACRKINELQTKNLRLSVDNSRLIEDSIKAREILTRQAEMDVERDDLRRRLYDAELLIELMKDERYRANEKYESLYRHYRSVFLMIGVTHWGVAYKTF